MPRQRIPYSGLTLLAALALAGCGNRHATPGRSAGGAGAPPALQVEGYVVAPVRLERTLVTTGTLKPLEQVALMPEVMGRVVSLNLSEGQRVRQGALLLKLFDGDLQAQLGKAQAQSALAEQALARQRELLGVSGVSQSEVDAAALQVNAARAEIEVLKAQIRKTEIHAPFDGVIGLRQVSLGAQVTPGTVVAELRRVDRLKLDFSVPERYAAMVRPGQAVSFVTQGSDRTYAATVTASEEAVDLGTRSLSVRALVENSAEGLLPGTSANVTLILAGNPQALMIPTQAIVPQEDRKTVIVARQGKATVVAVETGVRRPADIEVTDGLTTGDTVVTTGLQLLRPGSEVRFSQVRLASSAAP
jgi:membrane fusion protein (multidrug efflux system)